MAPEGSATAPVKPAVPKSWQKDVNASVNDAAKNKSFFIPRTW
jgi:hypothetical protein